MEKDIKVLLDSAIAKYHHYYKQGKVATYIPALGTANPENVGICIQDLEENVFCSGEYEKRFTIQSISKILTLALAIMDNGEEAIFNRVGLEPTGDSFNSILKMEINKSPKPYNPMINAGAIVVTSMIKGNNNAEKLNRMMEFFRRITGNPDLSIDNTVYLSEKETGHRNRALTYFMKDAKIIERDVEEVLDLYFQQCSILVTCKELARIAGVFANEGKLLETGEQLIPRDVVKRVRTIMVTCGMYDASGAFAAKVGLPAKSGVGGGIIAIVPQRMGIGIYGPALEEKGNSIVGMKILEEISKELDLSIF